MANDASMTSTEVVHPQSCDGMMLGTMSVFQCKVSGARAAGGSHALKLPVARETVEGGAVAGLV